MAEVTKIFEVFVNRGAKAGFTAFSIGAGADAVAAVISGDPVSHDNDTSYLTTGGAGNNFNQLYGIDPTFAERMAVVNEVRIGARVRDEGATVVSNRLDVFLGGVEVLGSTFSSAGTDYTAGGNNVLHAFACPDGNDWTEEKLRDATLMFGIIRPSQANTLRVTTLWMEADYIPKVQTVEPHREAASRHMKLLQDEPTIYTVTVPLKFISMGLTDLVSLSHDSMFASAAALLGLPEHMLVTTWRRTPCFVIGRTINFVERTMTLTLLDATPYLHMFSSTLVTPSSVSGRMDGMPITHVGSTLTVSRTTPGYLPHPSSEFNVTKLSTCGPIQEKRNHFGTLCEPGIANDLADSVFSHDFGGGTPWTKVVSTGTIVTSTSVLLYEDTDVTDRSCQITKGSGDTYIEQAWTHGGGDSRVTAWYKQASGNGDWALQRDDGDWWDDTNETWSATLVWNASTGSTEDWFRVVSKLITGLQAGTTTVRFGLNAGLANDVLYVGSVNHTEDRAIYSDIPTDENGDLIGFAGVAITDDDAVQYYLDNGGLDDRQVIHPDRVTHRLTLEAEQDFDGVASGSGTANVIGMWRWGAANTDYDLLSMFQSGANVRVLYSRNVGGSNVGSAFKDIAGWTRGNIYEIAVTVTSDANGELDAPGRTCSVYVDGVAGTPAVFSGEHSDAEQETEFFLGTPPEAGLGSTQPCLNWLRNLESLQRVLSSDEIMARR